MNVAETFGRNLRRTRRRAGLSQELLAARAALHRTAIGFLESGKRTARVDTLMKLAGALEADPRDLLRGIEWQPVESERFHASGWVQPSRQP